MIAAHVRRGQPQRDPRRDPRLRRPDGRRRVRDRRPRRGLRDGARRHGADAGADARRLPHLVVRTRPPIWARKKDRPPYGGETPSPLGIQGRPREGLAGASRRRMSSPWVTSRASLSSSSDSSIQPLPASQALARSSDATSQTSASRPSLGPSTIVMPGPSPTLHDPAPRSGAGRAAAASGRAPRRAGTRRRGSRWS